MTTIRKAISNVIEFGPKIVRDMREKVEPLQLKQQVMTEIDWQLGKLGSKADEIAVLKFLISHRQLDDEG